MFSILKSLAIGFLSVAENVSMNNTEFIKHHNSLNLSYAVTENQFINTEYVNEFAKSDSHYIVREKDTMIESDFPPFSHESIDWREKHKVSSVKNQAKCGGCWAFSSTGAVESAYAIKNNVLYNLSQQELLDCSYLNHGCQGGSMDLAFQFIMKNGLCTNNSYPYEAMRGECQKRDCETVVHISNFSDVTQNDEKSLARAVSQQPVSVAIQANKRSFQMYQSGIYSDIDCGTKLDHGVLVVGYGTERQGFGQSMDYWIVKNSWGPEWGENGYIRIQRNIEDSSGLCGIAMDPSYPIV